MQLLQVSPRVGAAGLWDAPARGLTVHAEQDVSYMQKLFPKLTGLQWVHSMSAGLDKLLFPDLVSSDVVVTNAKVPGATQQTSMHKPASSASIFKHYICEQRLTEPALLLAIQRDL